MKGKPGKNRNNERQQATTKATANNRQRQPTTKTVKGYNVQETDCVEIEVPAS